MKDRWRVGLFLVWAAAMSAAVVFLPGYNHERCTVPITLERCECMDYHPEATRAQERPEPKKGVVR